MPRSIFNFKQFNSSHGIPEEKKKKKVFLNIQVFTFILFLSILNVLFLESYATYLKSVSRIFPIYRYLVRKFKLFSLVTFSFCICVNFLLYQSIISHAHYLCHLKQKHTSFFQQQKKRPYLILWKYPDDLCNILFLHQPSFNLP